MKANLDPRALAAANEIKANKPFSEGPIIPSWLGAVLPPRSARRGWRDYVAQYILCDVISAHRLRDGQVFFRGLLYQVNRQEWADRIPTTLKEISLTLTWLAEDLGVIGRDQRVRLVDGRPSGTQTFVWPIVPRILELRDYFVEHGEPMPVVRSETNSTGDEPGPRDGLEGNSTPGFKATSPLISRQLNPHAQGNLSLTSVDLNPTAAEGSRAASSATSTNPPAPGGRSRTIAAGGGVSEPPQASNDADPHTVLAPPAPPPKAVALNRPPRSNVNGNGYHHPTPAPSTEAAAPRWSPPPPPKSIIVQTEADQSAWTKAMRFRALWEEAIVRSKTVSSSAFTMSDKRAAYHYFLKHPNLGGFFTMSVAIHAWQIDRQGTQPNQSRRRLYHIPHSLDPRQFLCSMNSGKVEAEVGLFVNVNTWPTLRWYYTESELIYLGWRKEEVPVMAIDAEQLWEYDPNAPRYYRDRHRDLPPEVIAVEQQARSS